MALAPAGALAGGFCDQLRTLTDQAATDFDGIAPGDVVLDATRSCGFSLGPGGIRRLTCHWPFAYRDGKAREKLSELDAAIPACLPGLAVSDDVGVNHPDTFEQRRYADDAVAVSLSLKDKVGLKASFVFLGVERVR